MKAQSKSGNEFTRFQKALRRVLSVSKTELQEREKRYKAERANRPKRGPKPKHPSASDRASGNSGSD